MQYSCTKTVRVIQAVTQWWSSPEVAEAEPVVNPESEPENDT